LGDKFVLFSDPHLITMGIGFGVCFLLIFLGFFTERKQAFAKIIAVLVLGVKIAELIYRHKYYGESVAQLQPVYFWCMGAFFAIIMPDIKEGMHDFASQSFFITHFFILFSAAYAFIHFRFRPNKAGFILSFLLLVSLAFAMYFVNIKLGTNYLFVNRPPSSAAKLIDYVGPWPYYLYSIVGIYILLSFILYLPFKRNKKSKYGSWKKY